MKITNTIVDYHDGNVTLKGYCAYTADNTQTRPAVIVVHDWSGRNEFACKKADALAELGYVGFAVDMFGDGKRGNTKEEKSALIQPFMQNRAALQKRILVAFETVKQQPQVDKNRIGAIGFCFGGLCVLDLARSGADVRGVVSFHGLLQTNNLPPQTIKAKVLALHGYDDPMVTPDVVNSFAMEMTHATADWQIHMYGHTMHAFTNPEAHDPSFGTVYEKQADKRSWVAMKDFFAEALSP